MVALITLLLIVALSLLIARVATTALTLTGLSRQAAKFQARSALTGAGFTTAESEYVVNHPVRRRIVMGLMLIGSAGIVSAIASLSVTFVGRNESGASDVALKLGILLAGVVGLLLLARNERVDIWLQRIIRRFLRRHTDLDVRDYASLLHVHGEYSVSELEVEAGDWIAGRTLAELALSEEGVLILGVQRGPQAYLGAPRGNTRIDVGDVLIVYGPGERIEDLDSRPSGPEGDEARRRAVSSQQRDELLEERAVEEAGQKRDAAERRDHV